MQICVIATAFIAGVFLGAMVMHLGKKPMYKPKERILWTRTEDTIPAGRTTLYMLDAMQDIPPAVKCQKCGGPIWVASGHKWCPRCDQTPGWLTAESRDRLRAYGYNIPEKNDKQRNYNRRNRRGNHAPRKDRA